MSPERGLDRRAFVSATALAIATGRLSMARLWQTPLSDIASVGGLDELSSLGMATAWINSPPLTQASIKGKVVLVQFWTFTCINWLRTLPYTRAWWEKYRNAGLVVIGAHTPEFEFEHDLDNVRRSAGSRTNTGQRCICSMARDACGITNLARAATRRPNARFSNC